MQINKIDFYIKFLFVLTMCFTMGFTVMDLNMQFLHKVLSIILYGSYIVVFFYWFTHRKEYNYPGIFKLFILFFLIYSYIIYGDLTTKRVFDLEDMLGCPSSVVEFNYNTFLILLLLLFLPSLNKLRNHRFLYNSYIYVNGIGVVLFILFKGRQNVGESALMISGIATAVALLGIIFRKNIAFSKNKNIALYVICVLCIFVWSVSSKRGPVLYFLFEILFFYILRNRRQTTKLLLSLMIVGAILVAFQSIIIDIVSNIAPTLAEKFHATFVLGDTSGRMGDEDSGYALAYHQILENPWTGTYFRITYPFGIWSGMYPHNLFLESMMTFGILGTIPLCIFMIIAIRKIFYITKLEENAEYVKMMFFSVLFLNTSLMLMSTGTILLNKTFWVSMGALLYFNPSQNKI